MLTKRLLLLLFLVGACAKTMSPKDALSASPAQMREAQAEDENIGVDPSSGAQDPLLILESQIQRDMLSLGLNADGSTLAITQSQPGSAAGSYGFSTGNVSPTAKQPPPNPPPPGRETNKNETKDKDDQTKKTPNTIDAAKPSEEDSCQKTCALVENICKASDKICEISERLPKDSDAPQRCQKSKNACERARNQGSSCSCSS